MVNNMTEKKRLQKLLLEKSYLKKKVVLTSGKESDFYIDAKQTTLSAEGAYLCGRLIFDIIKNHLDPIAAVGGMTLGADPLVTAVSIVSHIDKVPIPAFIVRKEPKGHGTKSYIEGKGNIPDGSKVAIVEDVVTTGGTLLKVIDRVEALGLKVAAVITVVDREEGGAQVLSERGYTLESIFTKKSLLEE